MCRGTPAHQRGAALLALILLIVAGSAWMLLENLNATAIQNQRDEHDARVLAEAKDALIAYAVTYQETGGGSPPNPGEHGFLPCPDIDETGSIPEGGSHGSCGIRYENSLGRLPWRSLGIEPLKDSAGECLWYAISGQYKANPKTEMLNADTNGTFEIRAPDGTTLIAGSDQEDRPVAVIFAPGESIKSQTRSNIAGTEVCGGNYTTRNYLEEHAKTGIQNHTLSGLADDIDSFIQGTANKDPVDYSNQYINDKIIYITKKDIWKAVKERANSGSLAWQLYDQANNLNLTRQVAECIADYGMSHSGANYSLPWPGSVELSDYRINDSYTDIADTDDRLSGRVPDEINNSNNTIYPSGYPSGIPNRIITECPSISSSDELFKLWNNWKDHLFYAVGKSYQPKNILFPTPACGNGQYCITINEDYMGSPVTDWAAVVIFSGSKIEGEQSRNSPPIDSDDKDNASNYLEMDNYEPYAEEENTKRYDHRPVDTSFNDILYCINDNDSGTGVGASDFEVVICPGT